MDHLKQQHSEMLSMAEEMLAIVDSDADIEAGLLATTRWRLAQLIGRHVADEDAVMRMPLINCGDRIALALVIEYDRELAAIRLAFAEHNRRWTPDAVKSGRRNYRDEVALLVERLRARIKWEESVIFPMAANPPLRRAG